MTNMSFDWSSYIRLAEELINRADSGGLQEACFRSAISRAYYGVFCIARNSLKARRTSIPHIDTHKFVREQYINSSDRVEKKIGVNLGRLWKDRKRSDYEDTASIDIKRVMTAIDLAKRSLEQLRRIGAT